MDRLGIVVCREGQHFRVHIGDREVICRLRGKKWDRNLPQRQIVIGDEVKIVGSSSDSWFIQDVTPRRSELVRPGSRGKLQPIAANMDQLVIVQSLREPNFKQQVVERLIALARRGRLGVLVVLSKCDLMDDDALNAVVQLIEETRVPVIPASVKTGQGLDQVRHHLIGQKSVVYGQSGVGKSSLLNALYPGLNLRTSTVSQSNEKGRHTTTASRLFTLPEGGFLADTPGIRSLPLFDDQEDDVAEVFPEIQAAAIACRFRNCSHTHEPDCAVKSAVQTGAIDARRLRSYHHMQRGVGGM